MKRLVGILIFLQASVILFAQTSAEISNANARPNVSEWHEQPAIQISIDNLHLTIFSSQPFDEIRIFDSTDQLLWLMNPENTREIKIPRLVLNEGACIVEGNGKTGRWRIPIKPI